MAIRFDREKKRLTLSVLDLCSTELYADTFLFPGHSSPETAGYGRLFQQEYTEHSAATIDDYQTEYPLKHLMKLEDYSVLITGRADAVHRSQRGIIIEEIKTLFTDREIFFTPHHILQCRYYGWLYFKQNGIHAQGMLTQLYPFRNRSRTEIIPIDLEETEQEASNAVAQILRWFIVENGRLEERSRKAEELTWPYETYRKGQEEIMKVVDQSLQAGDHLLLEAPPGSGKTAPILYAALHFAMSERKRLAMATSRRAQRMDRIELLEKMAPNGLCGRLLLMDSQDHLCPNHKTECHTDPSRRPGISPYDLDHWVIEMFHHSPVILPEDVKVEAERRDVCPYYLQAELARRADVLLADLSQLIDPNYSPGSWFTKNGVHSGNILLLDEAHGIAERYRSRYGGKLSLKALKSLVKGSSGRTDIHGQGVSHWGNQLATILAEMMGEEEMADGLDPVEFLNPGDRSISSPLMRLAPHIAHLMGEHPAGRILNCMTDLLNLAERFAHPEGTVFLLDRYRGNLQWELLDPGAQLKKRWRETDSTIFFSATLTPEEHFIRELGVAEEKFTVTSLPSPFPEKNLLTLRYTALDTSFRKRQVSKDDLSSILRTCAETTNGAWIVFFPSYAYLESIELLLMKTGVPHKKYRPPKGGGSPDLKFNTNSGAFLHLMTMGGVYSEGVEWAESRIDGIILVGPAIAPRNMRQEIIRVSQGEDDFEGYRNSYLIPAVLRLVQAAGRLIRSENQRGILLLAGKRFDEEEMIDLLPEHWRRSIIVESPESLNRIIEQWWYEDK